MTFTNRNFGEFSYEESHVVHFPAGVIGFESLRKFIVIHDTDSEPFRWLVSLEDEELSLPLLDPTLLMEEYCEYLPPQSVGASVFVVACLQEDPKRSTVNLRSPIVIASGSQVGAQMVLDQEKLPIHFPLLAAAAEPGR